MKACASLIAAVSLSMAESASAMDAKLVMEEFMVPAADPGISLYVRNKHPRGATRFSARPFKTLSACDKA